jgi:hypothetical protein
MIQDLKLLGAQINLGTTCNSLSLIDYDLTLQNRHENASRLEYCIATQYFVNSNDKDLSPLLSEIVKNNEVGGKQKWGPKSLYRFLGSLILRGLKINIF